MKHSRDIGGYGLIRIIAVVLRIPLLAVIDQQSCSELWESQPGAAFKSFVLGSNLLFMFFAPVVCIHICQLSLRGPDLLLPSGANGYTALEQPIDLGQQRGRRCSYLIAQ